MFASTSWYALDMVKNPTYRVSGDKQTVTTAHIGFLYKGIV